MTIKDFKTGQTVYALIRIKGKTTSHVIKKYTVLSVGRKYVKAALEGDERPDSFYLDKDTDDYLTENITWRGPAKLFLTEAAANDDVEKDMLRSWLKNATEWRRISDYTLEQLRAVREILEGSIQTTDKETKEEETGFDITKQELSTIEENFFFDRERNAFIALYDYDFNPDEYFGTKSNLPGDQFYLTFITEWNMDTDDIIMRYWGAFKESNGNGELEKTLTEKEKEFFKKLMDRFCMEIYGVSIFSLHRPLTEDERTTCATCTISSEENAGWAETGAEEAVEFDDDSEIEFDVRITMTIHYGSDAPDEETVTANIQAAFDAVNIHSLDDECYIDDDGTAYLKCSISVMESDSIDEENSCMKSLEAVSKELKKIGYRVTDISCDVKEA